MKQILCYGDSNTWGLIPGTQNRYPWGVRWTSILQEKMNPSEVRIIEEGLCGRTTVFEDSYREKRNGWKELPTILESQKPLDAAVLMLGFDPEFDQESVATSKELFAEYQKVARRKHVRFLAASDVAGPLNTMLLRPGKKARRGWVTREECEEIYTEMLTAGVEAGADLIAPAFDFVSYVGGCCGTDENYIREMKKSLSEL